MKKFEYVIDLYDKLDHTNIERTNRILNKQGKNGWELVSIQGIFWIFKREIVDPYHVLG